MPKPKLQRLRSRLAVAPAKLASLATPAIGTPRQRGRAWVRIRDRWLADHPLCVDCLAEGRTTVGHELDHIVPLWAGGVDDPSNYATRCKPHHAAKTAREAAQRSQGG